MYRVQHLNIAKSIENYRFKTRARRTLEVDYQIVCVCFF